MTRRYGLLRPTLAAADDVLRRGARGLRTWWRQRRIEVGRGVRIASSVECWGRGRILIGDGVRVGRGVVLSSGEGATLEVGAGSTLDAESVLDVRAGQILTLGARFSLGSRAVVRCLAGVEWGDDGGLGPDSQLGPRETGCAGRLVVGRGCNFQQDTILDLCADITVGDHVRSGPFCACYTHNHVPAPGKVIWEQVVSVRPIRLGDGVWIGQGCIFLPGVEVGANSIVAAGAVVTKNVEPLAIVGGVPARPIGRVGG